MHARVLTARLRPGALDEALEIVRDDMAPVIREQPGFRGFLVLTDREADRAITISLWETEADRDAGEATGYARAQLARIGPLFAAPPVFESYAVDLRLDPPASGEHPA